MTVRIDEIKQIKIKPLALPGDFRNFLGALPRNAQWSMLVYGPSGSGKSTFTLKLANALTLYGTVLYCNFEERLDTGTIQNKMRIAGAYSKKIEFLANVAVLDEVSPALSTGRFQYVIFDSISDVADSHKDILEILNMTKLFPDVSFIFVAHVDKSEKTYIGSRKLLHKVDLGVETLLGGTARIRKNRFQNGKKSTEMKVFR